MTLIHDTTTLRSGAIDPNRVPQRILSTGAKMPAIGLVTFRSDHVSPQAVADAVRFYAAVG
jgi:alcohol dehydrogenase (NADP+)